MNVEIPPGIFLLPNMAWHSLTGAYAWDMSDATKAWQEEDAWWDFDNFKECTMDPYECQSCIFGPNPLSFECGHFTQNVWKATTSVCIAKSENSQGTYIVARYNPPGNIIGYYAGEHGFEGPLDGNYIGEPADV